MSLSKSEILKFTKQEKKDIRDALNNLIDDINEIWKLSDQEEFYTFYPIQSNTWGSDSWKFQIDKTGIFIKDYPKKIYLEKFKPIKARPKVRDYSEIYYFIRQYEKVRSSLEGSISRSLSNKERGMKELNAIKDKYSKEATIELDLPQTMNPYSFDLKHENGNSIGEIKMNSGTIRIIVKGNIILSNKPEEAKVKVR